MKGEIEVILESEVMNMKRHLSSIKDSKGFYFGITDSIFKSVLFGDKVELTKWFLSKVLGSAINELNIINPNLPTTSIRRKTHYLDIVVRVNGTYCNFEANTSGSSITNIRNFCYGSTLFDSLFEKGKTFSPDLYVFQINLSRNLSKRKYSHVINKCQMQTDYHEVFLPNFVIYVYDIDEALKYWYSNNIEKIKEYFYLIMLVLGKDDLKKLS